MPGDQERLERFTTMSPHMRGRRDLVAFVRRLGKLGPMIGLLLLAGTLGIVLTTDYGLWDGFVLALDTVATLGSIPAPSSTAAELVKVLLIVLGVVVGEGCDGAGRTIGDVRGGAYIVGIRHADGSFLPVPAADTMLGPGDLVMALGTPNTLDRLEALFLVSGGRGYAPEQAPRAQNTEQLT